jgi:hypothetical protein
MPVVRCPDCFRNIPVSEADLSSVIECSVCEARFGPITPPDSSRTPPAPPPPPLPPPVVANEEEPTHKAPSKRRIRPTQPEDKPRTRVVPVLVGTALGLGATAALALAIYVLIRTQVLDARSLGSGSDRAPASQPSSMPP